MTYLDAHKARVNFECAMMQLRTATDSRGLLVRLGPSDGGHGPQPLFDWLLDFAKMHGPSFHRVCLSSLSGSDDRQLDPDAELVFARNLQLLVNAYVAAVEHVAATNCNNARDGLR